MRLEHLHVDRLPGLPDPFDLEPGPGVNLLLGPNAVGKSSVARAVRGLLWPARSDPTHQLLTARFPDGLEATRDGGRTVTWRRGGETAPAPEVPGDHLADCYRLDAPDLLVRSAGEFDRQLASELRREMTGGVDLDGLAGRLGRPDKGTATRLLKHMNAAAQVALAVGRQQAELDSQHSDIEDLEGRLGATLAARREIEALNNARDLLAARADLATADAARRVFPGSMAKVREEDASEFIAWQEQIATRKARIRELVERLELIERELTELVPPGGSDADETIPLLEVRVNGVREAAREAVRAQESLAGARRAWQEARSALAEPDALPEDDSLPDDDAFARLVTLHRATLKQAARSDALDKLAGEFNPGSLPSRAWPVLMLTAGVLFVLAPAVPGALPGGFAYGLLAAGLLLIAGGVVSLVNAQRQHALADRARRLRDHAETSAPVPEDEGDPWTLGRNLDEGGWLRDLDHLRLAARSRLEWRGAEAAAAQADSVLAGKLAACGELVGTWNLGAPNSAAAAEEQLTDLRRRRDERKRLLALQSDLRSEQAVAMRDRDDTTNRLGSLLARLGLPTSTADVMPIRDLVEKLPGWTAADTAWRQADLKVAALADNQDRPDLAELSPAEVNDRLDATKELAASAPDLQDELSTLRERVRVARAGHARASALAEKDRRRGDLSDWRRRAREQAVTAALLDELQREHDELVTPPQLERAIELFAVFTGHRHTLTVAATEDGPVFRTRDRQTGRWLELNELSGGTRAQLLLAVRLAFLDHAETGPRPPLFLDESLTTADSERLAAVAGSLGLLARDTGRQVFYLTSNPGDVGAWQAALEEHGLPAPTVLDLAAIRGRDTAATASELTPRASTTLPDPATHDVAAYGTAVSARRFDPREDWRQTDTIHLAAGDVDLVHRLRERGLARAGLLAAALDEDVDLPRGDRDRLAAALAVLRAFIPAWRVGRPRPVEVADIDASGAVSEKMRTGVLELLAGHRGHGARFEAALRNGGVKRFQTEKMDDLAAYLEQADCLDDRATLDADALVHETQKRTRTSAGEVRVLVLRLLQAIPPSIADDPSSAGGR